MPLGYYRVGHAVFIDYRSDQSTIRVSLQVSPLLRLHHVIKQVCIRNRFDCHNRFQHDYYLNYLFRVVLYPFSDVTFSHKTAVRIRKIFRDRVPVYT